MVGRAAWQGCEVGTTGTVDSGRGAVGTLKGRFGVYRTWALRSHYDFLRVKGKVVCLEVSGGLVLSGWGL